MGTLKKILILLNTVVFSLFVLYYVVRFFSVYIHGFSREEMDWNQNGTTSIFEYIQSSDIGKREFDLDGKSCTEYYLYKDGLPLKTVCK